MEIIMNTQSNMFSAKTVNWGVVRNIANSLTNQLYMGEGADIVQAHVSSFRQGPEREYTLEPEHKGNWRDAGKMGGWMAFDEADVSRLYWASMSSGNALEAVKQEAGKWLLRYIQSETDPEHRGQYFGMYENPEGVQNVDAAYVYQYRQKTATAVA